MVFLLSLGYALLVFALRLTILRRVLRGTKEENLRRSGITIAILGIVGMVAAGIVKLFNVLSNQEVDVLLNTGLAIGLTGIVLAIQGEVQKKPEQLKKLPWYILSISLVGIICIIVFIFVR